MGGSTVALSSTGGSRWTSARSACSSTAGGGPPSLGASRFRFLARGRRLRILFDGGDFGRRHGLRVFRRRLLFYRRDFDGTLRRLRLGSGRRGFEGLLRRAFLDRRLGSRLFRLRQLGRLGFRFRFRGNRYGLRLRQRLDRLRFNRLGLLDCGQGFGVLAFDLAYRRF
ncbi:MAG TPA: hypothetical protein VD840_13455, partial [Sinorhizobium sp.]|nr:hypothetical protein [Sinorhizobium sp.]